MVPADIAGVWPPYVLTSVAQAPYETCAASPYDVGAPFPPPNGYATAIAKVTNSDGVVVAWLYLTTKHSVVVIANDRMAISELKRAGLRINPGTRYSGLKALTKNPWRDLGFEECTLADMSRP